jgi:hypothetical protein
MNKELLEDMVKKSPNRRNFVRKLGLASAAVGVASALKPSTADAQAQNSSGLYDAAILNFALNLEFLEAEFFTVATTGLTIDNFGIDITGSGNAGATTGGSQVTFTDPTTLAVAQELANDERTHVNLLQSTILSLGSDAPIAKPPINLNALGFGFGSQGDFLRLARIFEDIGVSAYGGAAADITSSTVLTAAARILGTEAEHVGAVRLLIAQQGIDTAPPLDGADVLPPPTGTKYFSNNSQALTVIRTPGQVLYLAYGMQGNATSGGFFPMGVNGYPPLTVSASGGAMTDSASIVANPNPIQLNGASVGITTLYWSAPSTVQYVEVHVGSPSGPLFAIGGPNGSAQTGAWVTNGTTFYLQNITNGVALSADNTLATVTVSAM